jgi:hypothetical protein
MRLLALATLVFAALPEKAVQEGISVSVAPFEKARRWVLAEAQVKGSAPFTVLDKVGRTLPAQGEGHTVRWLIPLIGAQERPKFTVQCGAGSGASMALVDDPSGFISVRGPDREITRYHTGLLAEKHKKPFFYPLLAEGVNVLREWPVGEGRPGEAKDHPHHTGLYHAFGEVNGREYWSKTPIVPRKILKRESGPAYARIVAENAWGEDLVETQDVSILNVGNDAVIDWTLTLKAGSAPVVFAKDIKLAKEGSFALRLAAGLSEVPAKGAKDFGLGLMTDAKGNKGENSIRADRAPWVDYAGEVDGKKVGVAVMNHPSSFRYPTTWHVRAYGLFAANPWITQGENTLAPGDSLTLRYRVYVHAGDAAQGHVDEVFDGYTHAAASAE